MRKGTTAVVRAERHAVGRGSALTPPQETEIRDLFVYDKLNVKQIAERVGRTRETVARIVHDDETTRLLDELKTWKREQAKRAIFENVDAAADAWVDAIPVASKKGDHRPARDLLLHTDVIAPLRSEMGSGSVIVNIGIKASDVVIESETQEIAGNDQ